MSKDRNFRLCNVVFDVLLIVAAARTQKCRISENCEKNRYELDANESPYYDAPDRIEPFWETPSDGSDQHVDMMFVIDGSSAISYTDFEFVKRWILSFIQNFDLSSGKFQVGVVQYSHWYRWRKANNQKEMRTEVALGSCRNLTCLEDKFSQIKHIGHTAFTGFAINKTVNEDFVESPKFYRATKIMILLTVSPSSDQVLHSANYARRKEIHPFAIGLSRNIEFNELRNIATGDPLDNKRIYLLWSVQELGDITGSLVNEIQYLYVRRVCPPLLIPIHGFLDCTNFNIIGSRCSIHCDYEGYSVLGINSAPCYQRGGLLKWDNELGTCGVCQAKFDLLVIVDSSSSVRCQGFSDVKRFLVALLDSVIIGADNVQIALMRYYSDVLHEFNYDAHQSKTTLLKAIRSLRYCGRGTRMGKAIRYATNNQFTEARGRRKNIPHMTLLITDGMAGDNIKGVSKELRMISHVYSIGVRNANIDDLKTVSSKPIIPSLQNIYSDYKDLLNASLVRELLASFCETSLSILNVSCDVEKLDSNVTCSVDHASNRRHKSTGTICRLPCAPGYRNPGESQALCTYDGKWQLTNWTCIEKECEASQLDANAEQSCDELGSSRMCVLKCKYGFDIVEVQDDSECERFNNKILACSATCERSSGDNPKWSLSTFRCEETKTCAEGTCENGKCVKNRNNFTCQCYQGYTGSQCEINIDDCEGVNCINGKCEDGNGTASCVCDDGFDGNACEENMNECATNSCGNGGRCSNQINGYLCECDPGHTGKFCEEKIDHCVSDPCGDHGTCRDSSNTYKCECNVGYSGARCQMLVDPCVAQPCMNSGVCKTHFVGKYSCSCPSEFRGRSCEFDHDECSELPPKCQHGAKCVNTNGSYYCQCSDGYEGPSCEDRVCYLPQMRSTTGQIECSPKPTRDAKVGSTCRIYCPPGTRLKSYKNDDAIKPSTQISITCLESGKWSASRFIHQDSNTWQCVERSCAALQRRSASSNVHYILQGQQKISSNSSHLIRCTDGYKVGSRCTLKCHATYSISANPTRKCGNDGIWSGRTWRCVPRNTKTNTKTCKPSNMPFVKNGKYNCPEGHGPGKYCSLVCAPGFIQDNRVISRIVCIKSNGVFSWRKLGDAWCYVGECEVAIDLQSPNISNSMFFTILSSNRTDKFKRHKCRTGAVISMNITEERDVRMFLHFGELISGNHMALVIDKYSDNNNRNEEKSFSIVGLGNKVFLKGITLRGPSTAKSRQEKISPNSTIELRMSYNQWKWRSASEEWIVDFKRKGDRTHNSWYTVHMGLNRGSKEGLDGYGLCKVCFTRN